MIMLLTDAKHTMQCDEIHVYNLPAYTKAYIRIYLCKSCFTNPKLQERYTDYALLILIHAP